MRLPARLLLLGGPAELRDALSRSCADGDMATVPDVAAALAQVRAAGDHPPRLIVVGGATADPVATVAALKGDQRAALIPLAVFCAMAADAGAIDACYRAGANACVRLPADAAALDEMAGALAGFWLGANEVPPSSS